MRSTIAHVGRHLSAVGLVLEAVASSVYRGTASRRPVFRLQREPDVELLLCPQCHACSASQMRRPETLEWYYQEYYEGFQELKVTFEDQARLARHIARDMDDGVVDEQVEMFDSGGGWKGCVYVGPQFARLSRQAADSVDGCRLSGPRAGERRAPAGAISAFF